MGKQIDGVAYSNMLKRAAINLKNHAGEINDLNVFPIPDGDTGDNMLLTLMGGVDALKEESTSLAEVSRNVANGMLFSARGNSGVILSQFFDGIAAGLSESDVADSHQLGKAFRVGVKHAYNAVMKPTEGTILTVAHDATEFACTNKNKDAEEFFGSFIEEGKRSLDRTPDLLPMLKKAGVVDSGAAGLICIVEGMFSALDGDKNYDYTQLDSMPSSNGAAEIDLDAFNEDSVLEFGYCTELLVRLQNAKTDIENFDISLITDFLQTVGDSIAAFKTGSIVKIHVHTKTPDKVLAFCQQFGEFLKLKIENMTLQHNSTMQDEETEKMERKAYGVVAVACGEGIQNTFREIGTDVIVEGGQSMNPSSEDFLKAFDKVNADTIFVFPNNSNVILAAKQAAQLYSKADVRIINSKTIGDGYAALTMTDGELTDPDEVEALFNMGMENVITAEVSQCVRDADMQDVQVHKGDYIGFVGKNILSAMPDRKSATMAMCDKIDWKLHDICILINGVDSTLEETEEIKNYIESKHGIEVYCVEGKQEIYSYILIAE
ncbi:MAG: DAK2 domain-containing protein [Clostridia bacterium]|nr:DAK2 domain-containing protein [Clostridia bacterium]